MPKPPAPIAIDFETFGIESRPQYPPKPVGVAIECPGAPARYYAWGHPSNNNCTQEQGERALRAAWADPRPKVFFNGKFDVDVAETHCGCPRLPAAAMEDVRFLGFLDDPHRQHAALKPLAEELLGLPPDERDEVRDWLVGHQPVPGVRISGGKGEHGYGKYIAYAPGDLVGRYAIGDVNRTAQLFKLLYPQIVERGMKAAYEREKTLMPILLDNERKGIRVDPVRLLQDTIMYEHAKSVCESWLRKTLRTPNLNVDSPAQLVAALDKVGAVREWQYTATGSPSTSKDNLTLKQFAKPQIFHVLAYHGKVGTALSTFMRPWLSMALQNGGWINTNWSQTRGASAGKDSDGARTNRLQSSPNFQNIPKSFEGRGGYTHPAQINNLPPLPLMRSYILPDNSDSYVVRRDYNQQELRILAHFEDGELLQNYVANPRMDVHDYVKAEILQRTGQQLTRDVTKQLNFGMLYGMGSGKLAARLEVPVETAVGLKNAQLAALPGLRTLQQTIRQLAKDGHGIRTWGGRHYLVEPPRPRPGGGMQTFEYKLLNYLIQGSAADCTKEALVRYHTLPESKRYGGRFMLTVHDEIDISAPKKHYVKAATALREVMQSIEFDIPMLSDAEYGDNWAELAKLPET